MRTRMALALASVVLAGTGLAGCSDTDQGQALPTGGQDSKPTTGPTSNPPDGTAPGSGAPPVEEPLDTSRFQQAPCDTLTQAEAASISSGVGPGEVDMQGVAGPECSWTDNQVGAGFGVGFATNGNGLQTIYKKNSQGGLELFKPIPDIRGHPAVIQSPADQRDTGVCGVAVGLTDTLALTVTTALNPPSPDFSEPCSVVREVADLAMQTMKESA